ncbi:MAG TPA: hypothetical protein VK652_16080 [Steroidobacteraceae bacterium]|jgi:hypothetical protein|nr:hypothetical protein [Steroidobacteraceae bacterium]
MGILARSVLLAAALLIVDPAGADAQPARTFRLWLFADAHVGTDKANGRDSLATALEQSEGASGFDWDIALDLGDISGAQGTPKDEEGAEIVRQFGVLKKHRREQIYDLSGNHDRSGLDEAQAWGSEHAPQGWYSRNDKVIKLSTPFNMPSQVF